MEDLNHWNQYRHQVYNSIIIGAGITGLSMAMWLKLKNPKEKILICDKGMEMASRRNVGFVTSGSLKYLLDLIRDHGEKDAFAIWNIGKNNRALIENFINSNDIAKLLQYQKLGSVTYLNSDDDVSNIKKFGFEVIDTSSKNGVGLIDAEESSFNPIRFHDYLLNFVINLGVEVDFNSEVSSIIYKKNSWEVSVRSRLQTKKLFIATNSSNLLNNITNQEGNIKRVRAQVQSYALSEKKDDSSNIYIPTERIYYRINNNKLIIGGLRGVDPSSELTDKIGINPKIQDALRDFVMSNIDHNAKIEKQWSGIMGMRDNKLPHVYFDTQRSLFFLGGYSGHGNAFAFYLSKELIESIATKRPSESLVLFL